jgi:hypothetical protein
LPGAETCRQHAETFDWAGVADRHRAIYLAAWQGRKSGWGAHRSDRR